MPETLPTKIEGDHRGHVEPNTFQSKCPQLRMSGHGLGVQTPPVRDGTVGLKANSDGVAGVGRLRPPPAM